MPKLSHSPTGLLLVAVALAMLVTYGLYARANLDGEQSPRPPLMVDTRSVVQSQNYVVDRWFSGRIEPRQRVQISSELSGRVVEILVDEGDEVTAGEVLLALDRSLLEAERDRLTSRLGGTDAEIELANKRLQRFRKLGREQFSSADSIDSLETSLESLSAQRENLLAQIQSVDIRLAKSVLRAPFDGSVQQRLVDIGTVIGSGTPILELLQQGVGEIKVGLPVELASEIAQGDIKQVMIRDQLAEAEVLSVAPGVDPVTQTVAIRLQLSGVAFRFGEFVDLRVGSLRAAKGFWVPSTALVEGERGLWNIFAVDAEGMVHKRAASVLFADNRQAYIDLGDNEPLEVIVSGLNRIAPGMQVAH